MGGEEKDVEEYGITLLCRRERGGGRGMRVEAEGAGCIILIIKGIGENEKMSS